MGQDMNFFRFLRLFVKGLNRNFKIIQYGDVPEVYKTESIMERFSKAQPGLSGFIYCCKELCRFLLKPEVKVHDIPPVPLIYCGASKNNEREFIFFSDFCSRDLEISKYSKELNLSFFSAKILEKTFTESLLSFSVLVVCFFYLFRIKINPVSLKYLTNFGRIYLQIFISFHRSKTFPKSLVVANDHTDIPVVASMVMQYYKVPVIYVQHAEVSNIFPPLDFCLSILRNEKSLNVYRECGRVVGETFIIPRRDKLQCFPKLKKGQEKITDVVLYLSSVFDENAVKSCIEDLRENPDIASVGIKPHPRGPREFLHSLRGVTVYENTPSYRHVAVVPNSSVVIELLEEGIPVFQLFAMDAVERDYYGFVREGIAPEIVIDDLREPFWVSSFYDEQWVSRFAAYSPAVDDSWRASVSALMTRLKAILRPVKLH